MSSNDMIGELLSSIDSLKVEVKETKALVGLDDEDGIQKSTTEYIETKGFSANVPKFLRSKTRIRNIRMGKRETGSFSTLIITLYLC